MTRLERALNFFFRESRLVHEDVGARGGEPLESAANVLDRAQRPCPVGPAHGAADDRHELRERCLAESRLADPRIGVRGVPRPASSGTRGSWP